MEVKEIIAAYTVENSKVIKHVNNNIEKNFLFLFIFIPPKKIKNSQQEKTLQLAVILRPYSFASQNFFCFAKKTV